MAQEWNNTTLPWQNTSLPYKDTSISWNNTSLPWKAVPNGGGGSAGSPIGLLLALTKAN